MNPEQIERAYIWVKVIAGDDSGGPQVLENCGLEGILRNRILIRELESQDAASKRCMGAGIIPVLESARSGDDKHPMAFYFYGMPGSTTLEDANRWIASAEGMNWTRGARAWILMYGVGMLSSC